MTTTTPDVRTLRERVERLVDEERTTSLWFLRGDYDPRTDEDRVRLLTYVERHGDLSAYREAATLRRWLSQTSSAASADA